MKSEKLQTREENDKGRKKAVIILLVLIILLLIAALAGLIWYNFFNDTDDSSSLESTTVGGAVIRDDWDTGIEDADSVTDGSIQIPGYSNAVMSEGDTTLSLSIGNPSVNSCGFYATVVLDDGTVLFESELLEPGQGMDEITLNQTLEKGEYTAAVHFDCVTLDESHSALNSAESGFTLIVE